MTETTKRRLLIALLIATLVPVVFIVPFPALVTAKTVSLWFADVFGFVGIVLLLWMYILGAKSIMGLFFKDLAPVLSIHKWLGKYAVPLIFIHPLLIVISLGESFLYPFLPDIATLYERHVTLGRIAFWLLLLTWFVSAILRDKIAFRPWKYLHYLAYICVPFALLHVPDVGSHYMSSAAVKTYFFTLVVVYSVITLARLRGFLNLDKLPYTVVSHTKLSDTDYVLNLKPKESFLQPKRGQYVYMKLGLISEDHPFSALQYDEEKHTLAVGYRVSGSYTNVMTRLQNGDTVYVGGPYGSFMANFDDSDQPVVFISGGIGITPFVDQIIAHSGKREQWLFAANRSPETAVLVPEVAPYLKDHLASVYSQGSGLQETGEESGYITAEILQKYLGENLSRYSFYLCGPPPMMESMRKILIEANVLETSVKSEKFGW